MNRLNDFERFRNERTETRIDHKWMKRSWTENKKVEMKYSSKSNRCLLVFEVGRQGDLSCELCNANWNRWNDFFFFLAPRAWQMERMREFLSADLISSKTGQNLLRLSLNPLHFYAVQSNMVAGWVRTLSNSNIRRRNVTLGSARFCINCYVFQHNLHGSRGHTQIGRARQCINNCMYLAYHIHWKHLAFNDLICLCQIRDSWVLWNKLHENWFKWASAPGPRASERTYFSEVLPKPADQLSEKDLRALNRVHVGHICISPEWNTFRNVQV